MSTEIKNAVSMANYFTCTLGEAAEINSRKPSEFKTMNDLIDIQAKRVPNNWAVAFPVPRKDRKWGHDNFSRLFLRVSKYILTHCSIRRTTNGIFGNCFRIYKYIEKISGG